MADCRDRFRGALVGLAAGDALGTTLEFKRPGSFTPITSMVGEGPFHLKAGEWTDDTSMALCLAASLVEMQKFDPMDQMKRYLRWAREGYMSSNGKCFDIGITISKALKKFEASNEPLAGSTNPRSAGNGSLMRLAPVPMAWASDAAEAIRLAAESSRTTHGAPECLDACRYFAGLLVGALRGASHDELMAPRYHPTGSWGGTQLSPKIDAIAAGSFKEKQPPEIKGKGYVVDSLEAALWSFASSNSFEEGALLAANLGDDADTTAAIFGQLAGAVYGCSGIPQRWQDLLVKGDEMVKLADGLLEMAGLRS